MFSSGVIAEPAIGLESAVKPVTDRSQKLGDCGVTMVSGDIVMEILPDPLDLVRLGAVRRQEVQLELVTELTQDCLHAGALMDNVVVEDDMDPPGAPVGDTNGTDQVQKQPAGLAVTLYVGHPIALWIISTCQISLFVLSWRSYPPPPSGQHPVTPDAGVQVDVDLIKEEHYLPWPSRLQKSAKTSDSRSSPRGFPGTRNERLRLSQADPHGSQNLPQMSDRQGELMLFQDDLPQRLQCPGRTRETVVVRSAFDDSPDRTADVIVDLALAVLPSTVEQTSYSIPLEACYDPRRCRRGTADLSGCLVTAQSLSNLQEDAATNTHVGISGFPVNLPDDVSGPAVQLHTELHVETSLSLIGLGLTSQEKHWRSQPFNKDIRFRYGERIASHRPYYESCEGV